LARLQLNSGVMPQHGGHRGLVEMRTLVYKRTHPGDPNSRGHFGNEDCMGRVRSWDFDAVIGVGGLGAESSSHDLDYKINWMGIGPRKRPRPRGRGPVVAFDHFILFEEEGPDFATLAPRLARRLFEDNVRVLLHDVNAHEKKEIRRILRLAADAAPSEPLTPLVVAGYARRKHHSGCSCGRCPAQRPRDALCSGC
jgi:hypothetical protein